MEFKDLTIEELAKGYIAGKSPAGCTCIFCGEFFEEGLVHESRGRLVTAERAACEHVFDAHGSVFDALSALDKQISGISDVQKAVLRGMYQEKDNKEIGGAMGISAATVRTHKFHLQKMKREAKILLALLAQIENEELAEARKQIERGKTGTEPKARWREEPFRGNSLHPFFTQFNLK